MNPVHLGLENQTLFENGTIFWSDFERSEP